MEMSSRLDVAVIGRSCEDCGLPRDASPAAVASNAPCPYCGHPRTIDAPPVDGGVEQLHRAFYRMPLISLQRLKMWLRSTGEAPLSYGLTLSSVPVSKPLLMWIQQQHDEDSTAVKGTLGTMADVLLALYVISEEPAPADQLHDVIVSVVGEHLDQLPLPSRGPCFCGHGKRYGKCHGRSAK